MNYAKFSNSWKREADVAPIGAVTLSRTVKTLKRDHPKIYRKIFRRRYSNVSRFSDYRCFLADYACLLVLFEQNQVPAITTVKECSIAYAIATQYDFPTFFVSPKILEATMATKADFEIDPANIRLPFESFYFVLPKNKLRQKNLSIEAIEITRMNEGVEYNLPGMRTIVGGNTSFNIRAKMSDGSDLFRSITEPFNPITLHARMVDTSSKDTWSVPLTNNDAEFLALITHVVVNLLFVMQARPELIETGERISYHKKSKSAVWSPNIIGRKYVTKTDDNHSTHGSPRMHWRRGHFRNQIYGLHSIPVEERPHKIIWIEPILIGGTEQ